MPLPTPMPILLLLLLLFVRSLVHSSRAQSTQSLLLLTVRTTQSVPFPHTLRLLPMVRRQTTPWVTDRRWGRRCACVRAQLGELRDKTWVMMMLLTARPDMSLARAQWQHIHSQKTKRARTTAAIENEHFRCLPRRRRLRLHRRSQLHGRRRRSGAGGWWPGRR
jgi:hypothetical protein